MWVGGVGKEKRRGLREGGVMGARAGPVVFFVLLVVVVVVVAIEQRKEGSPDAR